MKKNNFKLTLISTMFFCGSVNAEFLLNVNLSNDQNGNNGIIVVSPYDEFGFDENGIHRDGGTTDTDGFRADGRKEDNNSSINQTLDQTLSSDYSVTLTQDVVEGNFGYVSGILTFNTTPVTVLSVEGNTVVLDESLTTNPFPSDIDIILNGTSTNNSSSSTPWSNTVDLYKDVLVNYFPADTLIRHHSTGGTAYCLSDNSISNGTVLQQSNTSTRRRIYYSVRYSSNDDLCGSGTYRYRSDLWGSDIRQRTENRLVSSTTTDYFELSGVSDGDVVDIYIPIRLQVSLDGGLYQDVTLTRENINNQSLTFELNNIDVRTASFRITDLNHSTQFSNLTNIVIQPQMLRN